MKYLDKILILLIIILIGIGVGLNVKEQLSIDRTKIPSKLEADSQFQKWITSLRKKEIVVEADNFRFVEDSNVFNTLWTSSVSIDNEEARRLYEENMKFLKTLDKNAESPNEREIVNFNNSIRFGFNPEEVFFYGLREDRILRTKVTDCLPESNCIYTRASFLDNHVFFVIEASLKGFDKKKPVRVCTETQECLYTFKVHLVDLINNSRTVYESQEVKTTYEFIKNELY